MSFIAVYRRVIGLLQAERALTFTLVAANLLVVGLQFTEPVLFGRVVNLLASSDTLPRAVVIHQAISLLGFWACVGLVGIAVNITVALQADRLSHRNRLSAMGKFFVHVLQMPPSFHQDRQSGRILKIMLSSGDALFAIWLSFFREHLATFLGAVILLPFTIFLNWQLAIALIVLVVIFCSMTVLVIRHTESAQRVVEAHHSALAGNAQDVLTNVVVVQAFTRLQAESAYFRDASKEVLSKQFPVLNWWALVTVMSSAAGTITTMLIFVIGTILHLNGKASIGAIVSFMGFAMLLIGRLHGAMGFVSRLFMHMPILSDFFSVLDTKSVVAERAQGQPLKVMHGEVRFDNVCFDYGVGMPAVRDIAFTAKPGSIVALVGATGAGKSTTMALLQRFWDPTTGRILIDGQDIREVSLTSLRAAIGVVFQESMLFNRSIRENILIGRPSATEAELRDACRMAEALDFIERQAKGFDTLIGERGANLSGGQRQRIAIARAILKDPPLLVLDEATSALDAATEAKVAQALRALMAGRTSFVIAHRLSTIRDADEILVLDHGQIVERGSFSELLSREGMFAKLVEAQMFGQLKIASAV